MLRPAVQSFHSPQRRQRCGNGSTGSVMRPLIEPWAVARACLLAAAMLCASCASSDRAADRVRYGPASERVIADGQPVPKGGGTYKLGEPYQIDGQWFTPQEDPSYDRVGNASYYASEFHGRRTSNGEIFDMWALTAAHPTLPLPCYVYVTNLDNGRTLLLRVNDRGPYARGRLIDVSKTAARYLGFEVRGTTRVRVRYAGPASISGDDRNEQRFLARQSWFQIALSQSPQFGR
jgi:rare lipoprotein A